MCHGRNIHGRSLDEIRSAAQAMESIPSLYPQLDASGLLLEAQPKRKQARLSARMQADDCVSLNLSEAPPLLGNCLIESRMATIYCAGWHQRSGHGGQ